VNIAFVLPTLTDRDHRLKKCAKDNLRYPAIQVWWISLRALSQK